MGVVVQTIQKCLAGQDMGNIFHCDFVRAGAIWKAVALGCSPAGLAGGTPASHPFSWASRKSHGKGP